MIFTEMRIFNNNDLKLKSLDQVECRLKVQRDYIIAFFQPFSIIASLAAQNTSPIFSESKKGQLFCNEM